MASTYTSIEELNAFPDGGSIDNSLLAVHIAGSQTYKMSVSDFNRKSTESAQHYAELAEEAYDGSVAIQQAIQASTTAATTAATNAGISEANAAASEAAAATAAQEAAASATSLANAVTSARNSANAALSYEEGAEDAATLARSWAEGGTNTRQGENTNNAEYWAQYAERYAQGGLHYKASILFANIPTTGMREGDMYDITDDFTTDSRFTEGAGIKVKGGTNIAWNSDNKWDILALPYIPKTTFNGRSGSILPMAGDYSAEQVNYDSNQTVKQKIDALVTKEASDIAGQQSLVKDTVGWTGKNLFNGKATTKTAQGVTWTVNASDNNIVTVSGTPTGFEAFTVDSKKVLPVGEYVLSGISDMVNVVWNAVILYKNGVLVRDLHIDNENVPRTFSILASDNYDTIRVQLKRDTNNVVCSGTGKIMITDADITDPTYEPYHESVEEEIEQIYADNGVLGAKNLLNPSMTTQTRDGLTFTVNNDNTVTVNGTATASGGFAVLSTRALSFDGCILNGNPSTDNTKIKLIYYDDTNGRQFDVPANNGEVLISNTNGDNCRVVISYYSGTTVSNLTFKPMIRLASDPDDTYQPYAMTNRELTEEKINIADLKTVVSASSDFADFKTRIASL